ncbi:MAG: chromosome segregation protein SMC [Nitrososphaerota archaeon]|nr:chromosome segregation protein SMC [Nitrososphaerota archaeon]
MVYLKRIETKGFKSMGPKVMTTPVERGFVAITGPNGSGKSNLLDAILFCLGENSAKTLRVPNLGALIYDGSVEEQKPSSARVALQFDNSDRRIPIDSDSVTISRELKQTGESVYSLNGKHIQRNNLSELLEMALLTSRGLNIVLQGMITRISELVPDEKRKLIEQMVGVAQFDEKKDMALNQLKEADIKLEVAMAKIGEIRDRVQELERERNDQLRIRQLEEQIGWLRAASLSTRLFTLRGDIQKKRAASADSGSRLQQLQARAEEVDSSINSLETERSQLIRSAMDAGAAKVELEMGKLTNEIESIKRSRQEASDLVDRLRQVIPALNQMTTSNESRIAQAEQQIQALQERLASLETSKSEHVSKKELITTERNELELEISKQRSSLSNLRSSKDKQDEKLKRSVDLSTRLASELRSLEDRSTTIRERIKFFEESLSTAKKNITDLEGLLSSQRVELEDLRRSRTELEKLNKRVEEQLGIAALILEKAQNAVRKYDSEITAMENIAAEEFAISRLESLGSSNALDGYFGPLRNLITYESQYAQAIAAIGRDWLNAVVVRDIPSLLRVTEASKKLKISRLTTIPLSEVGGISTSERPLLSGLIAYVCDLTSCDPRIKNIIDFVFGDSVVVETPKDGFLAARRGFRAVTLQGDVFEPDVLAFQTGYAKKYSQISSLLGQQETYEGIREALNALQSLISKRKGSIVEIHSKMQTHDSEERAHDLQVSKIETKLETTKQFVAKYADDAKALGDKLLSTESEIDRVELALSRAQRLETSLKLGSQKLSAIIASFDTGVFDEKIAGINRRRMEIENEIERIVSEIRDTTTEITKIKADLENNQRPALEKLRQQRLETEMQLSEKSRYLVDSVPKLAEVESALTSLKEREAETIDRAAKYQPMLDSLDRKLNELKSEQTILRKSLTSSEREDFSNNSDLTRLLDNERRLVGELAMFGYAEPIEAFGGADQLLEELNSEYNALHNSVNYNADRNYREIFENYKYSSVRKNELEKERSAIVTFIETIDSEKRKVFMEAFDKIDKGLRTIFTKITDGNAWLEIEKPDSIFDSGVFLIAQFPGKLPRDSSSVSGGEKTMSALAFILAIQAVFPSPFYVFDEVDAHLDSVYSGKLAEILAERCSYSQIIIVSLKDTVVSKAGSVIGVYMDHGSSRVIRYKSGMEVELRNE